MNGKGRKIMRIFLFAAVFLPFLFSCSLNKSQKSFMSALDEIDALISQQQYKEALKELGKIEKKAYGSWPQLGVFRRYAQLGENARAEKVLVRALKSNPKNEELNAVYAHFLLRAGKLDQALEAGKCLQGTKYGSVYSEAVLQDTLEKSGNSSLFEIAFVPDYIPVYYDAYMGSEDNGWLRNCALIHLAGGAYESAGSVRPQEVSESRDAYFWALVMYDAGRFGDAVHYAQAAETLLQSPFSSGAAADINDVLSIEADAFTSLKDEESAEKIRREWVASLEKGRNGWIIPDGADENQFAVLFTNCARWAWDNRNKDDCAQYIFFAVNKWADFVPALVLYANFAFESNRERAENSIQLEIRSAGTTTLEMERFDRRMKIPVSDAVFRINSSLERTKNPLLSVVALDLKYKTAFGLSEKDKTADLWRILEDKAVSPGVYPDILLEYAVNFLLRTKQPEEAERLFFNAVRRKYDISSGAGLWSELYEKHALLTVKEREYAGYFAAAALRADDSVRLYESACFEPDLAGGLFLSPFVSDGSCMNLAMIYNSLGREKEALDLYAKTAGRCTDVRRKSEILYRVSLIYYASGDINNARRSAEYAVTLDSRNADARLLLARMKK